MQGPSQEEVRVSRLSFVRQSQSTDVADLRRVRAPVSRSKTGVQGKVADVLSNRSRHAESQIELNAFRVLLATVRPRAWQEQPFVLQYHHEGAQHRYTPDILIDWGAYQEVVEIKDDADAESSENQARFTVIAQLLADHGYSFRIWKRSEICAEPRLTNVNLLLRYRCVQVPGDERERIRAAFSSTRELRLDALALLSTTAVQSALHLVLCGTLYLDWWAPLSFQSKVSITPIGRQVWPGCVLSPAEPVREG
jgi:TnsA endonuclease-like protein